MTDRDLEAHIAERTRHLLEAIARLEELALTDDVTDLGNQRFLYQHLEQEFYRSLHDGSDLSVMMLDLDNLKRINDTHDHLFGSSVIKHVGQLLRRTVRNTDLLARFGGDEFCIILPHTCLADALAIGERVRTKVAMSNLGSAEDRCTTTISVGVTSLADCKVDTPRELLRAADRALYQAKALGRNKVTPTSVTPRSPIILGAPTT